MKKLLSLIIISIILTACKNSTENSNSNKGDLNKNKYAVGFAIYQNEKYTHIEVVNPWNVKEIQANYYLVKDKQIETPSNGSKILVPITSLASSSVTHLEFLSLLDELESLKAVCNAPLVYNEKLREKIKNEEIIDLGDAFQINIEKTMKLHPNALMMSSYNNKDANAERLTQAGIPIVYNNEWMETSLLGRAEWIKFVAAFYDKSSQADSIFNQIENNYLEAASLISQTNTKPKVLWGSNYRGTWYMPGGNSFMSQLLKDAGADYLYFDDESTGSLPLNFETVLKNFADTDIWLNCNFDTYDELLQEDPKHKLFAPVNSNEVYNFRKRILPTTANDFWESAIARPDLLLKDLIAILYPDLLPDYELIYSEKLD